MPTAISITRGVFQDIIFSLLQQRPKAYARAIAVQYCGEWNFCFGKNSFLGKIGKNSRS